MNRRAFIGSASLMTIAAAAFAGIGIVNATAPALPGGGCSDACCNPCACTCEACDSCESCDGCQRCCAENCAENCAEDKAGCCDTAAPTPAPLVSDAQSCCTGS